MDNLKQDGMAWKATETFSYVLNEKRTTVCAVSGRTHAEKAANARLIAAAPELLAACKALVDPNMGIDAVTAGLKAIAKAEGHHDQQ